MAAYHLALMPCGKPQAAPCAHLVELLLWLPGRAHFTGLEPYGSRSARTPARWFARPFPCARLSVTALGARPPRVPEGLGSALAVDASFVDKSGHETWGTGWFRAGMARAVRWGLEVTRLAAVDIEEGGAYPLCARPSPGTVRARRQACGADTGRETTVDTALALVREAVAAGAKESLGTRWGVADGGYSRRTFVEGVRERDLHPVGRLRRDSVLRWSCTGPHARRPGRRRPFDGGFDRRDLSRMTRTTLGDEAVDLYHAVLHGKPWQCWMQGVYVLPRGADPQTQEGGCVTAATWIWRRNASSGSTGPASRLRLPSATPSNTWASITARLVRRPGCTFIATSSSPRCSGPACRPGSGRSGPWVPFPCAIASGTISRRKSTNGLPSGRPQAKTPPMPRPLATPSCRHRRGCAHLLSNRGCPAPEHHSPTGPTIRFRPQNVSKP